MSLNWELTRIKDYKTVCWINPDSDDRQLTPATFNLIHYTMAVGMGEITTANAADFYARLRHWEAMHSIPAEERTTPAQVRAHIGLRTNVSEETDARWLKRMWTRAQSDGRYIYRHDGCDHALGGCNERD